MADQTIADVYSANNITNQATLNNTDIIYLGQNPMGTLADATLALSVLLDWIEANADFLDLTTYDPGSIAEQLVGLTASQTLTNKTLIAASNVIEEKTSTASASAPAPTGGSLRNSYTLTALTETATFAAPSGTPADGNLLLIRILDDGSGETLNWNAIYRGVVQSLPSATTASKTMYCLFRYNSADSKWDLIGFAEES